MCCPTRTLRALATLLLLFNLLLLSAAAQTTFSGTATAATGSRPSADTFGNVDLSGGPTSFIDLHWGYLDHTECGVNGAAPCNFVSDPGLAFDAGYNQSNGAPGCLGVCTYPAVPSDTYEGEGPSGTNDVQLDSLGLPTLGTPVGVQTSVSNDSTSSTSTCAVGYFASPFGPYNGVVNSSLGQTGPVDAMYQALDAHSTATAACTPNGGSVTYTFHHDYEKLGLVLPVTPSSPSTYFTQPICFDLNSGLPPFNFVPLPTTTPTPGSICFNQVLDSHTDATSASITVATAVLTDTDGSTLTVCKVHADVEGCATTRSVPPALACQSQGTGEVGTPFDSFLVASAGTPPYSMYSIITGGLPTGLMLNSATGEISGTPTTAGSFSFTGQVQDSTGATANTPASPSCHILITAPQLNVVKSPKGGTFASGSQITFSIVVSNGGTSTAKNVVLTDSLPKNGGLTWTSSTTTQGTCSITNSVLGCSLGNIAAGGSVTVTVSSPASTPAGACQSQPNPAAIATADNAPSAQDSGSYTCTPPPPQLNVVKTPKGGYFTLGGQVSYKIVVSNGGGTTANSVTLTDALPGNGGLVWKTATTTQGSCSITSNNLSCSLGNIATGGSVTVTVATATTTPAAACQSQPNPAAIAKSGSITVQDSGSQSCTPPPPQLKVVKTPKNAGFSSGDTLVYTVVVSNPAAAGSGSATNVTLSDQLPGNGGLLWKSASATQGSCSISSKNLLTCSLGTIAAGSSVTVTIKSAATGCGMCTSQPNPAAVAKADGGLQAQDSGSYTCASGYKCYTQNHWGTCGGGGGGDTLGKYWNTVYPGGKCVIGGKYTATFTSASAVNNYLPAGGTNAVLTKSYSNPTSMAGTFGGQVLALQINVDFSNKGITKSGFGSLLLASGPLAGDSVSQVLSIANTALGGGGLPSGLSLTDLTTILSNINADFDSGTANNGYLY